MKVTVEFKTTPSVKQLDTVLQIAKNTVKGRASDLGESSLSFIECDEEHMPEFNVMALNIPNVNVVKFDDAIPMEG